MLEGTRAVRAHESDGRVQSVTVKTPAGEHVIACQILVVADGVRSTLGKQLGRRWHRNTAYGVAARAYIDSERHDDPWISSHLELRDPADTLLAGYGWIFPLGDGRVNIGVGSLATEKRPSPGALRPLLEHYVEQRREDWELTGEPARFASALLPMGGAVSGVAGRNWALVGDAAACVNPLNGEGIDYGLEGGRLLVELLSAQGLHTDLTQRWPKLLQEHYGAAFSIARRLAGLLTVPRFLPATGPVGMRSRTLMRVAVRVMGNLVTEEDSDVVARAWRAAGRGSLRFDERPPFSD